MRTLHISLNYQKRHFGRMKREALRSPPRLLSTVLFVVFIAAMVVAGTWAVASHTGFVGAIGFADARGDEEA